MDKHDTFGTTQTFQSRLHSEITENELECPCCLSIVDAQRLKFTYWEFTHIGEGNVKCDVCSSVIPIHKIPPNRRF